MVTTIHVDGSETVTQKVPSTNAARGAALLSAMTAAVSGETIEMGAGTFSTWGLLKNGVDYLGLPGSIISYTGVTPEIIFSDAGGAMVSALNIDTIISHATTHTGNTYHDGFAVAVTNSGSNVRVEANEIYGGTTASGTDQGCAIKQTAGTLDIAAKTITGPQGSVYWVNGDCRIRAGLMSGTIWNDMSSSPTGALWVDADFITVTAAAGQTAIYAGGSQPTAQVWVRSKEIRSDYLTLDFEGGKNYIDALKLTYTGTGNSAILVGNASKNWVTTQKIEGAILQSAGAGGILHLGTLDWLDDTGDTGNFMLLTGDHEIHIHGGYFKAVTCNGINIQSGSVRMQGGHFDFSAVAGSNPLSVSASSPVYLHGVTLVAYSGQASIISGDGNPYTVYCYNCYANTAPDANITISPPGGLTINSNVQ